MRLRRIAIGLAAFVLVLGVLAVLLRWWVKQRVGPPPLPIVVVLPAVPEDNAYDVFLNAVKLSVKTWVDVPRGGAPVTAEQREALKQNEAALAELRRGLEKECVAPPLPAVGELSPLREFARLLSIESRIAEQEGRRGDVLPPLADGLRFGVKLERGSGIVHRLTAYGIEHMMLYPMQLLAESGALAEADLVSIIRLLAEVEANAAPIEQTIEVEYRGDLAALPQLAASGSLAPGGPGRFLRPNPRKTAAILRENRDAAVRLARRPYSEVKTATAAPEQEFFMSPSRGTAVCMSAVWDSVVARAFEMRSKRRGTQVLAAIELYRLRQGKVPQSLRDLDGLEVPGAELWITDPLTQKPYIYHVQDGDYLLYSVGRDLVDDGGVPWNWKMELGDVVFHKPTIQSEAPVLGGDEQ